MNWTIDSCYHIASLHLKDTPDETDHWVANCWNTMGDWMVEHPEATDEDCDAQWHIICMRPEGDKFKIIGGYTLLEV